MKTPTEQVGVVCSLTNNGYLGKGLEKRDKLILQEFHINYKLYH